MRSGILVLFTDQPDRSAELAEALDRIGSCRVLTVDETVLPAEMRCVGLVTDIDLLRPASLWGLRAFLGTVGPGLPFVYLARRPGERSLADACNLGASLSLSVETAPMGVAEALLGFLRPGTSFAEAQIGRNVERAGTVLTRLLDTARADDRVDAAAVEQGLDPILEAVHLGGLAGWLNTVRSYDDATYQHCLLVAGLAAQFSIDLGFSAADKRQLVRAALVHDVGKARIPREILNKPSGLDAQERKIMQTHAALGHEILLAAGGFDAVTLSVVRHHHELLDGSGYPDGLVGSEIPDIVRLSTICDIYAALVERRAYRGPMRSADALAILEGMGAKLDAALVRAFARTVAAT